MSKSDACGEGGKCQPHGVTAGDARVRQLPGVFVEPRWRATQSCRSPGEREQKGLFPGRDPNKKRDRKVNEVSFPFSFLLHLSRPLFFPLKFQIVFFFTYSLIGYHIQGIRRRIAHLTFASFNLLLPKVLEFKIPSSSLN